MPATVEIEWPLGSGTNVAQTFFPVVRVYDGVGGIPTSDHKLRLVLKKGGVTKDDQRSAALNPALDKTYDATSLTTNETGAHLLEVDLENWSSGSGVVADSDSEDGINVVALGGLSKREAGSIIIEE